MVGVAFSLPLGAAASETESSRLGREALRIEGDSLFFVVVTFRPFPSKLTHAF